MFFRKLLSEILNKSDSCTEEILRKSDSCIEEIRSVKSTQEHLLQQSEEQSQSSHRDYQEILSGINRHDMAIENMLDEWEEMKEQNQEIAKSRMENQKLIDTLSAYHDQFFVLRKTLGDDHPAWKSQLDMMETILSQKRTPVGLEVIEQDNIPVDYALHEITGTVETHDENRHGLIAEVLSPGYCYHGKVRKKALVTVYRMVSSL